jgi:hypothetical protein
MRAGVLAAGSGRSGGAVQCVVSRDLRAWQPEGGNDLWLFR